MDISKAIIIAESGDTWSSELREFLRDMNFEKIQVKTLKQTLLAIQSQRVNVVVIDAELLDEDGEFISIIKGMEQDLPIIVCTEKNTLEFETRIRQQRIFFYHIKSFGIRDLEMAISNAVNCPAPSH